MRGARTALRPFWGCLVILGAWLAAADIGHFTSPLLLPSLGDVLLRLWTLARYDSLGQDSFYTILRFSLGCSLGVSLGVVCGLIFGMAPRFYRALELPLEFLRAMPVTALFPLFLLIFGIGDRAKIAMAFLPAFLLISLSTAAGVRHADPAHRRMACVFGATPFQAFRWIVLFDALPSICTALRLSLSLSLIVTVVSEMFIGTEIGLGQRVYDSYLTSSIPTLYAVLLVLGAVGYSLNKAALLFERRFVFWSGR